MFHNSDRPHRRPHPVNALTPAFVRNAKPGVYHDGNGLQLRVDPTGSRRWVQRLTVQGKRRNLGLGGYPAVSLADAREKARENKHVAREGGNPLASRPRRAIPTFTEAMDQTIALLSPNWSGPKQTARWRQSLAIHALPVIGDLLVSQVSSADVLAVLTPIWNEKRETAGKVRRRIGAVMGWAIAAGHRQDNPATGPIMAAMPRGGRTVAHHRALAYQQVGDVLRQIRESSAWPVTKLAFELLILTATRSGDVRAATWGEVETAALTWTIPVGRGKTRSREHRVPLSPQAMRVLVEAGEMFGMEGLVFPSPRKGVPLSDMAFGKVLRTLGIPATAHGFRSSFRDWASECTDTPHAVMEAALAHAVQNAVEAAYARSDLFERRRVLMQQWADYVA